MQKCLMHAIALNEKALIPTVQEEKKRKKPKPTHLTVLHFKMHHIGFVFNSTKFQELK